MKAWLVRIISGLIIVGALTYWSVAPSNGVLPEHSRQVLKIGNQFSSDLIALAGPFDELVTKANGRIAYRTTLASRYNTTGSVLGWVATGITVLITIVAGILGIDPEPLKKGLTPEQRRSKLLLSVTILAGVSSAIQIVNDRVQKGATQNREAAQHLFEETQNARTRFANAGDSLAVAQESKTSLEKALFAESFVE